MLKIKLNSEHLDFQIEDEKTIGEILGKIEDFCNTQKATIIEVSVNDKILQPEELDELFLRPLTEELNIELFSISGNEIKEKVKALASEFINNAEDMENVAMNLQNGNDSDVIKLFETFSYNLSKMYNLEKLFDIAEIPGDIKFGEYDINELQTKITEFLKQIISALENKDTVEISDIAEYELAPLVKELGNRLLSI